VAFVSSFHTAVTHTIANTTISETGFPLFYWQKSRTCPGPHE